MTGALSTGDVEALRDRLCTALRDLPGATALYAFGSLAEGRGDRYSDIDLRVVTDDLEASLAARHAILGRVAPVVLEWTVPGPGDDWAATFLFEGVAPFQKLDLGFVSGSGGPAPPPLGDKLTALIWIQPSPPPRSGDEVGASPTPIAAFAPQIGSAAHLLIDQLLGGVRYAKARRRGQPVTCWRFAAATADAVAALLHRRSTPGIGVGGRLSTKEYEALDAAIDEATRRRFLAALDFSTPETMDRSVARLLVMLAELTSATPPGTGLPPPAVRRLLAFVLGELGVVGQSARPTPAGDDPPQSMA